MEAAFRVLLKCEMAERGLLRWRINYFICLEIWIINYIVTMIGFCHNLICPLLMKIIFEIIVLCKRMASCHWVI